MNTRILLIIAAMGIGAATVTACNTFSGMGKDIEATGEAITGSADKTKEKIKEAR